MAAAEQIGLGPDAAAVPPVTTRRPTVIVDRLHCVYHVHGGGSRSGNAAGVLTRVLARRTSPALRRIHAVRGVSFEAYEGDSIGLIGRNGSGKSTLLSAVAGLLPPASGRVYSAGQPTLLGVNAALLNELTGERNVMLGCMAMGMSKAEAQRKYQDIVDFSGIGEFVNLPMTSYSSGMGARLKFAIGAAKQHDVLLIDEALATGDKEFQRRSEARINELRGQAGTVFIVSHSAGVIRETCNRAIWLDAGQIRMDGDVNAVIDAYEEAY